MEGPFARVPDYLIPLLPGNELRVFAFLSALAGERRTVSSSTRKIAAALELSPATVTRTLRSLEKKGHIKREIHDPQRVRAHTYRADETLFTLPPLPCDFFVVLPLVVIRKLHKSELTVYAYLYSKQNNRIRTKAERERGKAAFPSERLICRDTGLSRETVREALRILQQADCLDVTPRYYRNKWGETRARRASLYRFFAREGGLKISTLLYINKDKKKGNEQEEKEIFLPYSDIFIERVFDDGFFAENGGFEGKTGKNSPNSSQKVENLPQKAENSKKIRDFALFSRKKIENRNFPQKKRKFPDFSHKRTSFCEERKHFRRFRDFFFPRGRKRHKRVGFSPGDRVLLLFFLFSSTAYLSSYFTEKRDDMIGFRRFFSRKHLRGPPIREDRDGRAGELLFLLSF